MPGVSTIRAELRASAQVPPEPASSPLALSAESLPSRNDSFLDSAVPRGVPNNPVPGKFRRPAVGVAAAASREVHSVSPPPLFIHGDVLTRYRLGLAWQLGQDGRLKATRSPDRPVTIELTVIVAAGRAIGVEIEDDDGFASLASTAAEQARQASRLVPVPRELGDGLFRVSLALRFEP